MRLSRVINRAAWGVAALASASLAASLTFGSVASTTGTFGAVSGTAYSQPNAFSPYTATGAVAGWEATTASFAAGYGVKGTYALGGTDDYLERTASVPTLSYPFWIAIRFKVTSASGAKTLLTFNDNSANNAQKITLNGTSVLATTVAGGSAGSATATSACASGTWEFAIAIFTSSSSRAIYTRTNQTGATDTTDLTPTGIDRVRFGAAYDATGDFAGDVGQTSVWSGSGPSAGQRTTIFAGGDPSVVGDTKLAKWGLDNALTDDSGSGYTLSASGDSVTAQNKILCLRDRTGNGYHLLATTSAPTWSASACGGAGGAVFTAASSQFLVCNSTPVTAAPFQVYAAANSSSTTAAQVVLSIANSAAAYNAWALQFRGDVANDPVRWYSFPGSGNAFADTSSGFASSTNYLLWGRESSSTSRSSELNGGSTGTNTDSASPSSANSIGMGVLRGSPGTQFLGGQIGFALVLNTSSTSDQASIEAWSTSTFGAP